MKYPYIFILTLFLSLSSIGQNAFKKATFKEGNSTSFLADAFFSLAGKQAKGKKTIIVSFTLTKDGKIESVFPLQFDTQKNAVHAILAIQKTSGKWNPTTINEIPVDQEYKIAFGFMPSYSTYAQDLKVADKLAKKKAYKKALKYYNKLIKVNENEAILYLKMAEIKNALNDIEGMKKDFLRCKTLQKEFLANVQLGFVAK